MALLLIRDGDQVHACERACPHEQADLGLGYVKQGRLHCPRHLAWFDLEDGRISPGWSSRGLRRYRVRIEDGDVQIALGDAG
ncbi:MAG: Ab [Tardiphaga sp.]|nr:Ab [Tardiphaga sp.]